MNSPKLVSSQPIIDAHHHLWLLDGSGPLTYPMWQADPPHEFFLGDYQALRRNYMPPDYREDSAGFHVVATVHVEAECSRDQQLQETQWVTEISKTYGMPNAIVAHAWFHTGNAEQILAEQSSNPMVRSIRSKPVTSPAPTDVLLTSSGSMQDPAWRRGFALLRKYGLNWDLRVPAWHLSEAAQICREHPDIAVVLNHTGFPWDRSEAGLQMWRKGMKALAECEQVSCKLSCLCLPDQPWQYEQNRDIVRETIDLFGVQRCMFASNFPVDSLRVSYRQMFTDFTQMTADFSANEKMHLFHDSAARFYRMPLFAVLNN